MGTKRKSRGSTRNASKGDVTYRENSRFAPDERFDDSQDEFEAGRDHILLEEAPEAKRRRKLREEEEFFEQSDAEIHPYESDELDDEEFDEDEEEPKQASKKLRGRKALSPTSDDENPQEEEEDFISGWGSKKENYYDADMIETEADALEEEEEAKKIQLKRLQAMDEADFGFDESEWATTKQDEAAKDKEKGAITEVLPELQVSDDMSKEDRLKILKQRYPEFEPLSKDFLDLQSTYQDLATATQAKDAKTSTDQPSIPTIKFRALSAYLGVITMYFVLLTSTAKNDDSLALAPAQLREHPVMEALINTRKQWEQVRNLQPQTPESDSESESEPEEPVPIKEPKLKPQEKPTKPKKTKAQKAADQAASLSAQRRAARLQQTEKGLAELSALLDAERTNKKPKSKSTSAAAIIRGDSDSDFGDETELTAHELAEKAKKRKSLRFYTSQIAQKANKRSAAGRDAGGDTDLPYRERLKDRQARLNAEAEKRGRKELTERERLGGESDEEDERVVREMRGGVPAAEGEDDYYDMVKERNLAKKEGKRKLADMQREAEKEGGYVEEVEEIGPDGKRKITYAIEKNKGLAPKRSKDVRNPRVKKRKKFEQKTKRLGSMRQVYKGGEGRGGYGGELTGIKKNLVKSVKL